MYNGIFNIKADWLDRAVDNTRRHVAIAGWHIEFKATQAICEIAVAKLQWHVRSIRACRKIINWAADHEVALHGGIPPDMDDPVADLAAEKAHFCRLVEEATR